MKKILSILFLLMAINIFPEEYSPIYPTTLQIKVKKERGTGEFTVFNTSDERKNFEIVIKDIDNRGQPSELSKYMKVFPRKFSLEPGKNKDIRVMITGFPEELMGKGEYKSALLIKGLSSKLSEKYESKKKEGITTVIDLKIDISMSIYGLTGNEVEEIEVLSFKEMKNKEGKAVYNIKVKNNGNYSYEIFVKGIDSNNKEVYRGYPVKVISGYSQSLEILKEDYTSIEILEKNQEKIIGKYSITELNNKSISK